MTERTCDYCGATFLAQSAKQAYCSNRHRQAAYRNRDRNEDRDDARDDTVTVEAIADAPGRARAGLDAWVESNWNAPELLVEAARALADEVDRAPKDSPLWGRYIDVLRQLVEAQEAMDAESQAAMADMRAEFSSMDQAEEYRAARCAAATTDEERRRWERLVPVGCANGKHDWFTWPAGRTACVDCGEVR